MISLKDFLNFDFTNDIKLLYPINDSEKISIQYISILEHPVEKFVREGEIVISTALSIRDTKEELFNFINEIYLSKAAAIMLSFPNNTYYQLNEIQEYFQELNFPILTLPWNHLFSDVVEHTLKEIWDQEKESQSYLDSLQKDLLKNYLSGQTLEYATKIISNYLNSDIIILDINNNIKCSFSPNTPIDTLLENSFSNFHEIPIISSDKLYGYLAYNKDSVYNILNTESLEQYIIMPLTLWFEKEWSYTTSIIKSKSEFVWKIANNEITDSNEIFSKARILDINPSYNYICFVGNISMKNNNNKDSSLLPSIENIILDQVYISAKELDLLAMATLYKRTIIIYLQKNNNNHNMDLANDFLDFFEDKLYKSLPKLKIIWGFDNKAMSIDNLNINYKNAETALRICIDSDSSTTRNCFQLSIRQRILFTLCNDTETVHLAKSTLQNIINYDIEKNSDLLDTLECYCNSNYNISETARLMHLHRQSLLYRINIIEDLCNLSLKNHSDLFVLEICIIIQKLRT